MSMNVFPVWIYVNAWYQQRPEEAFRYPHCAVRTRDGRLWETLQDHVTRNLHLSNLPLPQQPMRHACFPQLSSRCQEPFANTTTSHCRRNPHKHVRESKVASKSNVQVHQDRERE